MLLNIIYHLGNVNVSIFALFKLTIEESYTQKKLEGGGGVNSTLLREESTKTKI